MIKPKDLSLSEILSLIDSENKTIGEYIRKGWHEIILNLVVEGASCKKKTGEYDHDLVGQQVCLFPSIMPHFEVP